MLGIVIPVKPLAASKNWKLDNWLLLRTLKSVCQQSISDFHVAVVFTDHPDIAFDHPNVTFLRFPFPSISATDFDDLDYVSKYYSAEYAEKMMDKGKKIHYGCNFLIEQKGCNYLMSLDSDDLISRRVAEYVRHNSNNRIAGWRITKGYIYNEGSKLLIKKGDIQNINGGTHIIRADIVGVRDCDTRTFWNYNLFEAHSYTYYRIKDFHGETLANFPHYALIYIIHSANYSNVAERINHKTLRKIAKFFLRGRLLTATLRKEFGLYPVKVE